MSLSEVLPCLIQLPLETTDGFVKDFVFARRQSFPVLDLVPKALSFDFVRGVQARHLGTRCFNGGETDRIMWELAGRVV